MSTKIKISLPDTVGEDATEIEQIIMSHAPADSVIVETYSEEPVNIQEWIDRTKDVDGIVLGWKYPDEALNAAKNMKAISFMGTGIADQLNLATCEERGIAAYNVTGYGDNAVAELAIALMFATWHKIPTLNNEVHSGTWTEVNRRELQGSTLGIIGYGGIGKRVAEIADCLGMHIKIWSRSLTPGSKLDHGEAATLDEVLASSDVVSVHLALNPETINFINAASFAKMKDGAVFLNTARADVVDTDALVEALKNGKIASAGVDVFSSEPVPADNPLLGIPNAVLTPHIGYNTENAVKKLHEIGTLNLVKHFWPDAV
ncbi:MAG TPA: NAD(P)-dependent oxidoreductase [Microbacteriaceae bacterium]|nr:NAD(P)-dependent oxidoreductase [Microbacteriaceae bacterium]